jgi:hypothetical protein
MKQCWKIVRNWNLAIGMHFSFEKLDPFFCNFQTTKVLQLVVTTKKFLHNVPYSCDF